MGMLLRRHKRDVAAEPKVNGKPVKKEPKNKVLTEPKQGANPQTNIGYKQ